MEKVQCPGNQEWSTETCSCQCVQPMFAEGITECPGKQQLNLLCHCACPSTPVCRSPKIFDPAECGCVCRNPQICSGDTTWDSSICQCAPMEIVPMEMVETVDPPQVAQSAMMTDASLIVISTTPSNPNSNLNSNLNSKLNSNLNSNPECLVVGQRGCDSQGHQCCNADSLGILCIALSEMNRGQISDGGVCCIGYNHEGCSTDNDCCFANSFCEISEGNTKGLCRRKVMQLSGHYDPSESVEQNAFQSAHQAMNMHPAEGMNSKVERVMLSPGVRIWAVVMTLIILSNVLCCARVECKSWTKEQAKRKRFTVGSDGADGKEDRDNKDKLSLIRMEVDERDHVVQLKSGEFDDSESE